MVKITGVEKHSLAERCGIREGDVLLSLNGHEIGDVLDYRFYLTERVLRIRCQREDGDHSFRIEKGEYEDIGLDFETPLMDQKQSCRNKCIFCFIDQLPKGLRETLYFKDDDARLSFLHGNYITLTNLTDRDVERIIGMHISPMNVSVHTTDPSLRVRMMNNKRAGEVLSYLRRFADAGIRLHAQIVLCRGINDGEALAKTMRDMLQYVPALESLSVVPSGLTKYREGLCPLEPFDRESALAVLRQVNAFGDEVKKQYGTRIFYCADEFYILAGEPIPDAAYYEEYLQLENGVGMVRSLVDEFREELLYIGDYHPESVQREVSIATGVAAYPTISCLAEELSRVCPGLRCHVYRIVNRFFGEQITVAGLLTGKDLSEQLAGVPLGEELLIPRSMLKADEDIFLCNMTLSELSASLGVPVKPSDCDGVSLLRDILGVTE